MELEFRETTDSHLMCDSPVMIHRRSNPALGHRLCFGMANGDGRSFGGRRSRNHASGSLLRANPEYHHRTRDILKLLLPRVLECEVELS
jgi:hypothetical protein